MRKTIKATFFLLCMSICLILSSKVAYAESDDIYDPEYYTHNSSEVSTYSTASSQIKAYDHGDKEGSNIALCVDVSKWNDDIDWKKVKNAGVKAAFIRIGHSMLNNGALTLDPYYEKNIKNAKAAGIKVGVYYYSQATNAKEAINEVNFILKHLNGEKLDLPVVYDAECGTYTVNGKVYDGKLGRSSTSKSATKWSVVAREFCDAISDAGYTPMIYGSISKLNSTMGGVELSKDYQIWIARYNHSGKVLNDSKFKFKGNYQVWQYTEVGKLSGIYGTCDLNFLYEDDLHVWTQKVSKKATPTANGIKTYYCNYHDDTEEEVIYSPAKITLSDSTYTYDGKEHKPTVKVKDTNGEYIPSANYKVTYDENCKKLGEHTVTVTFKGQYKGTMTKTYTIERGSQKISASNITKEYTKKTFSLDVTLTRGTGALTYESSDPSVATVNSKGMVTPKKLGTTTIKITAAETKNYKQATKTITLKIEKRTQKIRAVSVVKPFSTKSFSLGVKLTIGTGKLTYTSSNTNVATVSSKGKITPKKIGKTKITITASETKTYKKAVKIINVTIKPVTPTIRTVRNVSSKAMKLTWKKDSKATGYTIRYSTSKSMKKAKSVTIKKNSTTNKTIKKLTKGKTYYVQIRSNHKSTGLKSDWSKVKSVKIKK